MTSLLLAHPASADPVDDYLREQMDKQRIPGLAVLVLRDGQVVKQQTYGVANIEWDAPVGPDTAFQLASATKLFTSVLVMRLVEQEKLDLDAPITSYLTDLPESWSGITLRHLLAHQSGIPDVIGLGRPFASVKEAVAAATERPLEFTPGEKTAYMSADATVLMLILETVSGKPFATLLQDEVLAPIGAASTAFNFAEDNGLMRSSLPIKHRAGVYYSVEGTQRINDMRFPTWTYAAGGLFSTIDDLSRLFIALGDNRLLTPGSLTTMWTAQTHSDGSVSSFGIGWTVGSYRHRKTVGHSGGPALADVLHFVDEKLTVIVLTNQQNLFPYLAQGVADRYLPADAVAEVKGIDDPNPAQSAHLRDVVLGVAKGTVEESVFTADAQKTLVPALRQFGPQFFSTFEPLSSFVLVQREVKGDQILLQYAARYGTKPILWVFSLDQDGKIAAMEPKPQ